MRTENIRTVTLDTITELPAHPVADIFPELPDEVRRDDGKVKTITLAELADSILESGLQEPIVLFNGSLLDGRNRRKACVRAAEATQTPIEEFEILVEDFIGSEEEAVKYILDLNLDRRDLDPTMRATAAVEYWDYEAKKAHERQGTRNDLNNMVQQVAPSEGGKTRDVLAQRFRVNKQYIQTAWNIKRDGAAALEAAERATQEAELQAQKAEEERVKAEEAKAAGDEVTATQHFQASSTAINRAGEERQKAADKTIEASKKQNTLDKLKTGKTNFSQLRTEAKKDDEVDNPTLVYRSRLNTACSNIKAAITELAKASDQGEDDYNFAARKITEIMEHFDAEFGVML